MYSYLLSTTLATTATATIIMIMHYRIASYTYIVHSTDSDSTTTSSYRSTITITITILDACNHKIRMEKKDARQDEHKCEDNGTYHSTMNECNHKIS